MRWRNFLLAVWVTGGLVLEFCVVFRVHAQAGNQLGFTIRVSAALMAQFARTYPDAPGLLRRWQEYAAAQKSPSYMARLDAAKGKEAPVLQLVNDFFNRIPYKTDQAHWRQLDYWATPAESVSSNGGDCEDYAIAKYYLLKELGVPISRLRITYVKAIRLNEAHMVLAYYAQPDADPLILDNIENGVRPASERNDLVPVYVFNDDEVAILSNNMRGNPMELRTWVSLQERLMAQSRI
jgi:predicted transglutaminase-like cysteine proteinase